MRAKKRKVCFVITSYIHYSRNFLVLRELQKRPDIELHVVVAGSALIAKYSARRANVLDMLERDRIKHVYEIHFNLEGDKPVVKTKTAGLGVIEFSAVYNQINPDVVLVRGDRFEVVSAALAALLMGIPIAHIEGGDVTGTLDETIRHVITKLSHIHFTTNDAAKKRVLKMGEDKHYVFNVGSPDIEVVEHVLKKQKPTDLDMKNTGSGATVDLSKPYVMVMFHPAHNELKRLPEYTRLLLETLHELNIQTLWFWPNFDAGAEEGITREIRLFDDKVAEHQIRFLRYLPPEEYLTLLNHTQCLIGNSSAGIKECSYLGIPVVNVGSRQHRRLRDGTHVCDAAYTKRSLIKCITRQLKQARYPKSKVYYKPHTARQIATKLATASLYTQKEFKD